MTAVDRPMQQPERHFWKLAQARFQLEDTASRYPGQNADYQVLLKAVRTLDEAARHFGLEALWFKGVSGYGGGRIPHTGLIQPLED